MNSYIKWIHTKNNDQLNSYNDSDEIDEFVRSMNS